MEQKRKIIELEILLKKIQEENRQIELRHQDYELKIESFDTELGAGLEGLEREVEEAEQKDRERAQFISKVKNLLGNERKKRKLLQLKQYQLQDSMKDSENFIITLDSIFTRSLRDELLEGIVTDQQIKKLEKGKANHKAALVHFKKGFETLLINEQKLQTQIHEKVRGT